MSVQALVGNRGLLESGIGFELPERAVQLMMIDGIDAALTKQEERWRAADLELQKQVDGGPGQIDLERFDSINIKAGPHRTILQAPPEGFPAMAIQSGVAEAAGTQFDQWDDFTMRLYIEVFVKTGPVEIIDTKVANEREARLLSDHEVILNRRIERTAEAVHAVMQSDRTLRGATTPMQQPPQGRLYPQAWIQQEEPGGRRYMWQGARLQYTLIRQTSFQ